MSGLFRFNNAALGVLLLCLSLSTAVAQPDFSIKRTLVNWPTVELEFTLECAGSPVYNLNKLDYSVWENGNEVSNFSFWCPDTSVDCSISAVLVFDASSAMAGSGQAGAKLGGHAFIDKMDGVIDEATILWYNYVPHIFQQMTTIKPMLRSAVDALPASGGRALWDGAYAALTELINNGVNQCRGVVILTGGADNSSTRVPDDIISLAQRHRISVFTIALGFTTDQAELERMATATGGKFYTTPNSAQLAPIYEEIIDRMRIPPIGCRISYDSECADGSERNVVIEVRNTCGGSDTATTAFTAPMDSSSYLQVDIALGAAMAFRDSDVRMPVNLVTTMTGATLRPFGLRIMYDSTRVSLLAAEAHAGSLYAGAALTITRFAGGAIIETAESRVANAPGRMFDLVFHTNAVDTGCADIRGGASWFTGGCMIPQLNNTTVCIYPNMPVIACTLSSPTSVIWDEASGRYDPEQFPVIVRLQNNGGVDGLLQHVRIEYPKDELDILSPASDTVFLPGTVIGAGQFTAVGWDVAARLQGANRNTRICIVAAFANHAEVRCCVNVFVQAAQPGLRCNLIVSEIMVDTLGQQYSPMPFDVTLELHNVGGQETDAVSATIDIPPDLELAAPDAPATFTKQSVPAIITPGSTALVSWKVRHTLTRSEKSYHIVVRAAASNTDTVTCSKELIVPAIPEVSDTVLARPMRLTICEGEITSLNAGGGYQWYQWNTGERGQWLTVATAGEYFCLMLGIDGRLYRTDTVTVTVVPAMVTPVITRDGDVLTCMPPVSRYQWFKDGVIIQGATGQTLTITTTGRYSVRVESADSCIAWSDPFEATVLSAATPSFVRSFDVWPEPSGGRFRVQLRTEVPLRTSIVVRSVLGQDIVRYESPASTSEYSQDIDLGNAPAGVYFLYISSGSATWVRPIVIAR